MWVSVPCLEEGGADSALISSTQWALGPKKQALLIYRQRGRWWVGFGTPRTERCLWGLQAREEQTERCRCPAKDSQWGSLCPYLCGRALRGGRAGLELVT